MTNILIIAKKEFIDIVRSNIFLLTLTLLVMLSTVSLFVAEAVFRDQVMQYNQSLALLQSLGKTPSQAVPQFYPLNLLRGVVDYIEIFGAILGIFLGYISVFKEKHTKAIQLILSRPVSKGEILLGKLAGNFGFVFALMTLITLVITGGLAFFSGAALGAVDAIKLLIFIILSSCYILVFFSISFFLSLWQRITTNALIIAFSVWLVFALIIPQIGDTMDPDNQVPGGFFKSMGLSRPQEKTVLANFSEYETIRNGVEGLSLTKHYERSTFAVFGIKADYNGVPLLTILKDKWVNIVTVLGFLLVTVLVNFAYIRRTNRFFE